MGVHTAGDMHKRLPQGKCEAPCQVKEDREGSTEGRTASGWLQALYPPEPVCGEGTGVSRHHLVKSLGSHTWKKPNSEIYPLSNEMSLVEFLTRKGVERCL